MKKIFACILICVSFSSVAQTDLEKLMQSVKQGNVATTEINKKREQEFLNENDSREKLFENVQVEKETQESLSDSLESQFEKNEIVLVEKQELLNKRLGTLKEMFGVVQGSVGDASSHLSNSLTNSQIKGRQDFLMQLNAKMGKSTQLPEIHELEKLWLILQEEMTQSGKIVQFTAAVSTPSGQTVEKTVTRIGGFNVVADGKYLSYDVITGSLVELGRQPSSRFLNGAKNVEKFDGSITGFGFDPTGAKGGGLLKALINAPNLKERIKQGELVGYAILTMLAFGAVICVWRLFSLFIMSMKVNAQLKDINKIDISNPLGRVLSVFNANKTLDTESLELRISEQVLAEMPKINAGLSMIKFMSMVAPLMGLLGTVVGMILTFQAITIFGAGDPKTMAGGISSALITTVLGLVAAIPLLFFHSLLSSKAREMIMILDKQCLGLIAQQIEQNHNQNENSTQNSVRV
ncbi:MotA/TolQ/ExbB proton channel family protein [Marinicellulosiphila megalodicopiae]|uniref:MotA/TolQ/ExbB proton channel family protein n=1 Tax=Marinicellulosiphila megalodicopiae TaxID=2724896 RepID=UPI003BAE9FEF